MSDFNSSLPVRTETAGDVIIKVADATVTSQQLAINADGSVNITDNGASLTVDATNLDIRDLTSASDSVEVLQSTHDDLNANANIQVGDADVSNSNPVPMSDAGGSITVDGSVTVSATDLDIRDLTHASDSIKVGDGTDFLAINNDGSLNAVVSATNLDIRDLTSASDSVEVLQTTHDDLNANANIQVGDADVSNSNPVPISDAGSSITVDASNLDIRDLTHASDSVKIGDGSDFLAINADGSINVVPQDDAGTEVVNYDTSANIGGGSSDNHDYVFTTGGKLYQVFASGSGRMKIEIRIETGSSTNTFNTAAVAFNSTANPNMDVTFSKYAAVPVGARVRVIRTNRDVLSQDVYSTIVGIED